MTRINLLQSWPDLWAAEKMRRALVYGPEYGQPHCRARWRPVVRGYTVRGRRHGPNRGLSLSYYSVGIVLMADGGETENGATRGLDLDLIWISTKVRAGKISTLMGLAADKATNRNRKRDAAMQGTLRARGYWEDRWLVIQRTVLLKDAIAKWWITTDLTKQRVRRLK